MQDIIFGFAYLYPSDNPHYELRTIICQHAPMCDALALTCLQNGTWAAYYRHKQVRHAFRGLQPRSGSV